MAVAAAVDADLVFADPPYDFSAWDRMLDTLRAPFVVAESGAELVRQPDAPDGPADRSPDGFPNGFTVTRSKRYGRTWVTFFER